MVSEKRLPSSRRKAQLTQQSVPNATSPVVSPSGYLWGPVQAFEAVSRSAGKLFRNQVSHEKPRQLVVTGVFLGILWFLVRLYSSRSEYGSDRGFTGRIVLFAMMVLFIVFAVLHTRDGMNLRPHPAFWRALNGLGFFYLALMVLLLVVPVNDGLSAMRAMFPEAAGAYSFKVNVLGSNNLLDCSINADTVYRQVSSNWFISHLLGFVGMMLMLRSWDLCWKVSIGFEFVELALVWLMPEFAECWWDSLIIDVLLSNLGGMFIGKFLLDRIDARVFDWKRSHHLKERSVSDEKERSVSDESRSSFVSRSSSVARSSSRLGRSASKDPAGVRRLSDTLVSLSDSMLTLFEPATWMHYAWPTERFNWILTQLAWVGVIVEIFNGFMVLHALGIPVGHWLSKARLAYIGLMGTAAVPEHYAYVTGRTSRIGQSVWLMVVAMIVEVGVYLKYGRNGVPYVLPKEFPCYEATCVGLWVCGMLSWFLMGLFGVGTNKTRNVVKALSVAPLFGLMRNYKF